MNILRIPEKPNTEVYEVHSDLFNLYYQHGRPDKNGWKLVCINTSARELDVLVNVKTGAIKVFGEDDFAWDNNSTESPNYYDSIKTKSPKDARDELEDEPKIDKAQ